MKANVKNAFSESSLFVVKYKRVLKWRYRILLLLICLLVLYLFSGIVLIALGRYLDMPDYDGKSDAAVVEGGNVITQEKILQAIELFQQKKIDHIIITLNDELGHGSVFGIDYYNNAIAARLDSIGVKKPDFTILNLTVRDPFTYNTARALIPYVRERNFHSLLIVHDNFHIRRSFLTYRAVFEQQGVQINPFSFQIYTTETDWWTNLGGVRRVVSEYVKLAYYWINGYL
jgi:uncharacterized SAM-binding protein YcdF (DUF218 family)